MPKGEEFFQHLAKMKDWNEERCDMNHFVKDGRWWGYVLFF
jgi:hypothetical protein